MIEVAELCKSYGNHRAVQGVSFEVARGEVAGFLGPNGAGKSTTLRIIAGFLGATSGRVRVAGFDVAEQPLLARARLGYMPEACPFYPEMRVREYLIFRAAIKQVASKEQRFHVSRAMSLAGISERSESIVGHLSKGYRQRLGLADALVADPELLILDEPTAGLDPNQIRQVRQLVRELSQEHTVLLSTHILAEVEAVCDRALVIDAGSLVAAGSLDELRGSSGQQVEIVVQFQDCSLDSIEAQILERVPMAVGVERWRFSLREQTTEQWVKTLCDRGIGIRQVTPVRHSLEDVFVRLTAKSEVEEESA